MFDGTAAEAEIDDRDVVTARFERGGDVLHAERLDPEERAEAEALVLRHRTQEENLHVVVRRDAADRTVR